MAVDSRNPAQTKLGEDLPTLGELIEKVGFGVTHFRFLLSGGGVWFADGSELLLVSAITSSLATEWNLDPMQRGSMVTMVFVGVLLGNVIAGPLGDLHGRRQSIIASYAGIFVFSVLSSFSDNIVMLGVWRLFVGASFGLGQPSWNVLGAEVTPARWRTFFNAASQTLFTLGEIYSAMLIMCDDPSMLNLHWRTLLRLGAIPSLLFGIASLAFLHQSPFFLAQQGQHQEASEVLSSMSRENCLPDVGPMHFKIVPVQNVATEGFCGQCRMISGNTSLLVSTVILMYTCFGLNFVYYGTLYAFPVVLPTLHGSAGATHTSAGMELLIGALWELPGMALGAFFGTFFPRKPVIKLYLLITASMLVLFAGASSAGTNTLAVILYHVGYYGIKCSGSVGFIVVYIYVCEVYPTAVRTTGSAMTLAAGRIAAMVSPLIYEKLTQVTGSFSTFFFLIAGICVLNLVMIDFLPYETFDSSLKESIEDNENPNYGGVPETAKGS